MTLSARTLQAAVPVLVAAIVLGLVIPTAAVTTEDTVWEEQDLVIRPHDGPNGDYVEVTDGEMSIDLATVGVNANATTSFQDVFDVVNHGTEPVDVWISHDAAEVEFRAQDGSSMEGSANKVTLGSGELETVTLHVVTDEEVSPGETLLSEFTIHAQSGTASTPTPTPTSTTQGPAGDDEAPSTPTPTTPPPPPTDPDDVEVVFDSEIEGTVTIRPVSLAELEAHPLERENPAPRALVSVVGAGEGGQRTSVVTARGADEVVELGQAVTLSGTRSFVGSMRSVDTDQRPVRAYEITPPPGYADTPAIVRIRVPEAAFGDAGFSDARIARRTAEGWQLLPTSVVGRSGGDVVLEARTPGFSVFAVFPTTEVRYTWEIDGETRTGEQVSVAWDSLGTKNVTLEIRDAMGRTERSTHRVLVNDPPTVTVEAPSNVTAGEPVELRANVTNEIGNATVTWTFPDGSQQTGETVEYAFASGEQTVQVTVEDEYGAVGTTEATFEVPPLVGREPVIDRLAGNVPLGAGLLALVVLGLLLVAFHRRGGVGDLSGRIGAISLPSSLGRGSAPTIATLDDPTVDPATRRFLIGHLRIEDPDGDLDAVELAVLDAHGTEVAQKTLSVRGRSGLTARDVVLLPKSPNAVLRGEAYTVTVRAVDRDDRWSDMSRTRVRTPASWTATA